MKIDIHTHCALKRLELTTGNPKKPYSHYVCEPDELKETLKTQGISKAILMSAGENAGNGVHGLGAYNRDCIDICGQSPEFFSWMCNFDPVSPESLGGRMEVCKKQGAVGVGEVMLNQWLDSPFLSALFTQAEKNDFPVLCHMSPEPGFGYGVADRAGLPLLEEILKKHPRLIYIGHSQVFWLEISEDCPREGNQERSGFGKGPVKPGGRVEQLMEKYPNLYGDLSANSGCCAITRDEEYGPYFLNKFQDRLLFATDTTNRYTNFPLTQTIDRWRQENKLSSDACEKIYHGNAERIFHLVV